MANTTQTIQSPFYRVIIQANNRDISSYITSLKFEDSIEESDILTLTMNGVPVSLLDDNNFQKGMILKFSFGFIGGRSSRTRIARITNIDPNFGQGLNVTIKAMDLGVLMKKIKGATEVFENKSIVDMVKFFADKYKLELVIQDLDPAVLAKLSTKISMVCQTSTETPDVVIKKILKLSSDGSVIIFSKDNKLIIKQRGLKNPSIKTYTWNDGNEIIMFKPKEDDTAKESASVLTETVTVDPATNKSVTAEKKKIEDGKTADYVLDGFEQYPDNGVNASPKKVEGVKESIKAPFENISEAESIAANEKAKAALKDVTATLSVRGNPDLITDTIITMAGVGKKYSGNWYINKATHDIGSSGYITVMELGRNASAKATTEDQTPASDANNSQGPKDETQNKKEVTVDYIYGGK